jgi:hypothetical protein
MLRTDWRRLRFTYLSPQVIDGSYYEIPGRWQVRVVLGGDDEAALPAALELRGRCGVR